MAHEPIGHAGDDLRHAMLSSLLVQLVGGKAKPADFMPQYPWPQEQPDPETEAEQLRAALESEYGS